MSWTRGCVRWMSREMRQVRCININLSSLDSLSPLVGRRRRRCSRPFFFSALLSALVSAFPLKCLLHAQCMHDAEEES